MSQHFFYPPVSASLPGTISANQGTPNSLANGWPVKVTDGVDLALVSAAGELNVIATTLPLPSGAATSAKQDTQITAEQAIQVSAASIDTKTPSLGQAVMASSSPVVIASNQSTIPVSAASLPLPSGAATEATLSSLNAKVTAVNTGAVVVSSSALPSGASTAAKQATSDINVTYDYRSLTYVGATTKVNTITYKTGGSGGTSVATQTFAYDGSDRVTSITTTYP